MWSPGRAHPLASPRVPAGPTNFGASSVGSPPRAYPAQHHGCGSPLRLLPMVS